MPQGPRIALLHTGAVVIPMAGEFVKRELPGVTAINYLDDRIVADLGDPDVAPSVPGRVADLAKAAADAGAEADPAHLLLDLGARGRHRRAGRRSDPPHRRGDGRRGRAPRATGSRCSRRWPRPAGRRPGSSGSARSSRVARRRSRASSSTARSRPSPRVTGPTHDRLVAAAIERAAVDVDVVVLAQASMASAASAASVDVPVLTSLESGVKRLRALVESLPVR